MVKWVVIFIIGSLNRDSFWERSVGIVVIGEMCSIFDILILFLEIYVYVYSNMYVWRYNSKIDELVYMFIIRRLIFKLC